MHVLIIPGFGWSFAQATLCRRSVKQKYRHNMHLPSVNTRQDQKKGVGSLSLSVVAGMWTFGICLCSSTDVVVFIHLPNDKTTRKLAEIKCETLSRHMNCVSEYVAAADSEHTLA